LKKLNVVIPKGSIYKSVIELFTDAGIGIQADEKTYRPAVSDPEIEIKIMRPQNIPELIEMGSHDAGFTGFDWIQEANARIVEIADLKLDPVRIVAAVPQGTNLRALRKRRIVAASEYERLTRVFLNRERYKYRYLRTYGATEVFPPEDADMIVDNTATGAALKEHKLRIFAVLMESTTRFITNKKALGDPWKRNKILELKMLFQSVVDARDRVMLEMNVPKSRLKKIVKVLPCMRAPTVAQLFGEQGYAVKTAVKKTEVTRLIPALKKLGATDILEYEFKKVVI
jgi:ATP phosphoribosyltransferase